MSLADSRLHVSIRPCLEYRIPETCTLVRDVLLGDRDKAEALRLCEECLQETQGGGGGGGGGEDHSAHTSTFRDAPDEDHEHASEEPLVHALRSCSALVCSHVDEYVTHLSAVWRAYLDPIYCTTLRKVNELNVRCKNARRMRERYITTQRSRPIVLKEYRTELKDIEADLEQTLVAMRARPTPQLHRPDELTRSSQRLRDEFAAAYGRVSTKTLLKLKREFETQLNALQHQTALRLVTRLSEYLQPQ